MSEAVRMSDTVDTHAPDARVWMPVFLEALRDTMMVTKACEAAGVARQTAYKARQRDEDFALAWAEIKDRTCEILEREAFRRAVEGVTKPLVSAGRHVCDVTEYSDGLLTTLLRANMPEKYRENIKVEHGGRVTQTVEFPVDAQERSRRAAMLLRDMGAVDVGDGDEG